MRSSQFKKLIQILNLAGDHFIVIGDFNAITANHEKEGGRPKTTSSIVEFSNFINDGSLMDLGYVGRKFTWSNRQFDGGLVQERLDRGLVSTTWRAIYLKARVMHLKDIGSDHCPLLLDSNPSAQTTKRRFKFQERWTGLEEVKLIVASVWAQNKEGSPMFQHFQRLKQCRHELVSWQRNNNVNSSTRIKQLCDQLVTLKEDKEVHNRAEILALEKELTNAYQQEERFWKEKSRINWLRWGDQNTRFFHAKTKERNRRNKIWRLKSSNGDWCTDPEAIGVEAGKYFMDLFSSCNPHNPETLLAGLRKKVSNPMNRSLTRPVSDQEVKRATFSINPMGAPGDDGFTAKFYQAF